MFHLPQEILRQRGDNLSGGEKQRVAIIRALLMKKKYMLADEITSALDEQSTKLIMQILWQQEDLTILSVSHDPTWIEACNPILKLENKKIIRQEK